MSGDRPILGASLPSWIVAIYAADETLLASARFDRKDPERVPVFPAAVMHRLRDVPITLDDVIHAAHTFERATARSKDGPAATQIQITTDERPHRIVYVWRDGEILLDQRRGDPSPNAPDVPGPWPIHSRDGLSV